jgi:DNA polymerase-4
MYFEEYMATSSLSPLNMDISKGFLPLRWIYVDFNSYFASVEQQERPELRHRPIAVVPVMTDATCAIAASYEAKAFGIKTGTPIFEARKLCPGLICVPARHDVYVDYHHRILEEIDRHLPVDYVGSIDEMACRLMNNEMEPEATLKLACSIKAGLRQRIGEHVRCSIGIAPNRYLAKVATEMQKPDGLVLLQGDTIPEKLFRLKLRDLPGIGANMELRLRRAGIYSMEDLWHLPRDRMRRLWNNVAGERMWYSLRGMELPDEPTQRRTVGHSHVMAPDYRPHPQARLVARRLMVKAASRLRRIGYCASKLTFSARVENGPRWAGEAHCTRAQDNFTFLHLFELLWQQMMADMSREGFTSAQGLVRLKKVSVVLHGLTPEDNPQGELFDSGLFSSAQQREKREKVSRAMDALNRRFGRDTVSLGITPQRVQPFSGTKIAFSRIPDRAEFQE